MWQPSYSDEDFRAELEKGVETERQVAQLIRAWGHPVTEFGFEFRDSVEHIQQYTENQTDLIVEGFINVEVKSRTVKFTSPEDYPFADAALEAVRVFEAKKKRPDLYVLHSRVTDRFLVVDARTSDQWVRRSMFDPRRKVRRETLFVPKKLLKPLSFMEGYLSACRLN